MSESSAFICDGLAALSSTLIASPKAVASEGSSGSQAGMEVNIVCRRGFPLLDSDLLKVSTDRAKRSQLLLARSLLILQTPPLSDCFVAEELGLSSLWPFVG